MGIWSELEGINPHILWDHWALQGVTPSALCQPFPPLPQTPTAPARALILGEERVRFWKQLFLTYYLVTQFMNSFKKYNRTKIVETRQRGIRVAPPGARCCRSCFAGDTLGKCFFSIFVL